VTRGQRRTLRVLAIWVVVQLVAALCLLGWEFYSVTLNDQATISETVWLLWQAQPGAVMALALVVLPGLGYLAGHFFWQRKGR